MNFALMNDAKTNYQVIDATENGRSAGAPAWAMKLEFISISAA